MATIFREVHELREEGVLHARLIRRSQMLSIISVVLAGITLYDVFAHGVSLPLVLGIAVVAFIAGFFIFSRMNAIEWNEETSVVQTGRMDSAGFVVLALYIVFEIGSHTLLKRAFPAAGEAVVLAAVAGTLFGRLLGSLVEIHRVYSARHG